MKDTRFKELYLKLEKLVTAATEISFPAQLKFLYLAKLLNLASRVQTLMLSGSCTYHLEPNHPGIGENLTVLIKTHEEAITRLLKLLNLTFNFQAKDINNINFFNSKTKMEEQVSIGKTMVMQLLPIYFRLAVCYSSLKDGLKIHEPLSARIKWLLSFLHTYFSNQNPSSDFFTAHYSGSLILFMLKVQFYELFSNSCTSPMSFEEIMKNNQELLKPIHIFNKKLYIDPFTNKELLFDTLPISTLKSQALKSFFDLPTINKLQDSKQTSPQEKKEFAIFLAEWEFATNGSLTPDTVTSLQKMLSKLPDKSPFKQKATELLRRHLENLKQEAQETEQILIKYGTKEPGNDNVEKKTDEQEKQQSSLKLSRSSDEK